MAKVKPFLKWAGNKYRCLHPILERLPVANRLIEPFTGSGAVFMNTAYPRYLLAEGNEDLIGLFRCLQNEGEAFVTYCERFFSPDNNQADSYYQLRQAFNECDQVRLRAALFLYLNRHGYNGLCRYNQKGMYNVPFGRYEKPYFPRKEMLYFHQKSQGVVFSHNDFRHTFAQACPGDVMYCDPPYAPLQQHSNFTAYTNRTFGEKEQIILSELAEEAANRGVTVIISNHDTDFTRYHYRHSRIHSFPVKRWISCRADARLSVQELLAVFAP